MNAVINSRESPLRRLLEYFPDGRDAGEDFFRVQNLGERASRTRGLERLQLESAAIAADLYGIFVVPFVNLCRGNLSSYTAKMNELEEPLYAKMCEAPIPGDW